MSLVKHITIWTVVVIMIALLLSCTRGPVDPIQQYGNISGYVRGMETQKAIDGATVTLVGQEYQVSRSGIYVFSNVPEGSHILKVEKVGFHPYNILIQIVDNTVHNVYMAKMIEYRDISGHVYLDGSSIPVPDAVVICGNVYDTTDSEGSYYLNNVLAQTHKLIVLKNHYISFETRVMLENDTIIPIYLASAQLSGIVKHRLFGPIEGARVMVGEASTFTISDGSYVLPTAPQGTHQITVSHPDYDSNTDIITIGVNGITYDMVLTKFFCDTIPVELDASIYYSQFDGCSDCPEWGDSDYNSGLEEQLKLEYYLKTEPGPPLNTFVAKTRILLELPTMPEGVGRLNITSGNLLLHPVGEYQSTEFVSMRTATQGSDIWEENSVTWANSPSPSALLLSAEQMQPGQPLSFDIISLFSYLYDERVSITLQKEEIGQADPAQRLAFWSSEAPEPSLRPMIVLKYSY